MRARACSLLGSLTLAIGCFGFLYPQPPSHNGAATVQPPFPPYAVRLAKHVEQLNPNDVQDAYKIFLVLRSPDVPAEQRVSLAKRILSGSYPDKPDFRWDAVGSFSLGQGMFVTALAALSHLHVDDPSILPFLEDILFKFEQIAQSSPQEELPADLKRLRDRVSPEMAMLRAVAARLKAVKAVPKVEVPADLQRRVDAILKEAGVTRRELNQQYEEFMNAIRQSREAAFANRSTFPMHLVNEIGRTLFHYAKRGMDVATLCTGDDSVAQALKAYARAGIDARSPQRLIDFLAASQTRDAIAAQILVDMGVSVVPSIVQALEAFHSGDTSPASKGVETLLEVLGTLLGEDALRYIEPLTHNQPDWLRQAARRVADAIKAGSVFSFYPDW